MYPKCLNSQDDKVNDYCIFFTKTKGIIYYEKTTEHCYCQTLPRIPDD